MKNIIYTCACFALLCCSVFSKQRTCRILFLDRPDQAPKTLHMFDGKGAQEVELPKMNLSKIYSLPADCVKLTLAPKPTDGAKSIPEGAPTVEVPLDATDFYLIVTNDPTNNVAPVQINLIDASTDGFGPGKMLWYNFSSKAIQGQIGSEKLELQPSQLTVLKEPAEGKGHVDVKLSYFRRENQLRSICITKWSYDPDSRTIGFIFNVKGKLTPKVQNFIDFRTNKAN